MFAKLKLAKLQTSFPLKIVALPGTCSWNILEDAHHGSGNYLCKDLGGKDGGGDLIEGVVLAEDYTVISYETVVSGYRLIPKH